MSAPALPLGDLAARIDSEHAAATGAARTAIEHAVECGRLLIEAKAAVAHGEWLPWLRTHTAVSPRQSQSYMKLARHADELAAKCEATSHLTIDGALRLLAAPRGEDSKPPEPVSSRPREPLAEWSSPVDRARTCRMWSDIRDFACLWLRYDGWDESRIAGYLGLDVREVDQALYPEVDPEWLREVHEESPSARAWSKQSARAVGAYAASQLARCRANVARICAGHAWGIGDDAARRHFLQVERDATAMGDRFERKAEEALADVDALSATACFLVGVFYVRVALGLEPGEPCILWFQLGKAAASLMALERLVAQHGCATVHDLPKAVLQAWDDEGEERLRPVRIPYERLGDATYEELASIPFT